MPIVYGLSAVSRRAIAASRSLSSWCRLTISSCLVILKLLQRTRSWPARFWRRRLGQRSSSRQIEKRTPADLSRAANGAWPTPVLQRCLDPSRLPHVRTREDQKGVGHLSRLRPLSAERVASLKALLADGATLLNFLL